MKHAGATALDRLEPFLNTLRTRSGLKEKSRGTFYRHGRAFLHFHEEGGALYADARFDEGFERFPVTTVAERAALLLRIDAVLGRI